MNKIFYSLAALTIACSAMAQEATPNRLLVTKSSGDRTGFVLQGIQDLSFAKVDGEVEAQITINSVALDQLNLTVTKTPACNYFMIGVIPGVSAAQIKDADSALRYLNSVGASGPYYDDFPSADLTGISLNPDSDYAVLTVGFDMYGVAAGFCVASFKTPGTPLVGDPKVEVSLVETGLFAFTLKFVPNDDVREYYAVAGPKGELQSQYEQFGPMMGFTSINQMVMSWGIKNTGECDKTWEDMDPNTEYEVYVVATDQNGTAAPYTIFNCSTLTLGGTGIAQVEIELADYKLEDWNGEQLPSQYVYYTPNEETAAYRMGVYPAEQYDANEEQIKNDICSEPPMPSMAYWFFYEEMGTDYQINPDNECVAIAAGKNLNDEWGPITIVRFKTASEVGGKPTILNAPARVNANKDVKGLKVVKGRIVPANKTFRPGTLPVSYSQKVVLR